ncbi:MAG: hypothetical protein U0793_25495 [Gemmataceae bacterium]
MITLLSIIGSGLSMVLNWLVAQGRLNSVYRLGIAHGILFMALNILLACQGHAGMLFLTVPSAWAIVTCYMGLRRIGAKSTVNAAPLTETELARLNLSTLCSYVAPPS